MTDKIKVLYLTPSVKLLGARRSLLALVNGLSEEFEPVVVCPSEGALTTELLKRGVHTHIVRLYQWRKGKFFFHRFLSVNKLKGIIRDVFPDVIHCNEFYAMPYAVHASKNTGIPLVSHIRLNITERQLRKYFLNMADRIIVVSRYLADKLNDTGLEHRTQVIYNAIDPDEYMDNVSPETFRNEIGIEPSDILIGHLGGVEPRKRQHISLRAARKVVEAIPRAHFVFVGNARREHLKYFLQLQTVAKNLDIADNVSFIPFRKNISSVYASLDINLLISSSEGFGRTIIEAGYMGVPSIGTRVGGIPELIKDGESGFLVDLDDVEALSQAILKLAGDGALRQKMGQAARSNVEQHFMLADHCRKIEGIYKDLLD